MHDKLFHVEKAARLDSAERRQQLPIGALLLRLGPLAGQTWIDVGAGTGFDALPLAQAVAPGGQVVALDLQEEMITWLQRRVGEVGAENVRVVRAGAEALPLANRCADGLLCVACYHELADRAQALGEARRVLRPGAPLVVVDWLHPDDAAAPLPEGGPPLSHRLRTGEVERELRSAGLQPDVHRDWVTTHYVAVAREGRA